MGAVNGGAWLTVGGQRVDYLYRSVEHVRRVVDDAHAGRFELHYGQQPPFGFFSGTYLGELATCVPLFDRKGVVRDLKRDVSLYPEPLKRAVVPGWGEWEGDPRYRSEYWQLGPYLQAGAKQTTERVQRRLAARRGPAAE
jgi:hypothetical protein